MNTFCLCVQSDVAIIYSILSMATVDYGTYSTILMYVCLLHGSDKINEFCNVQPLSNEHCFIKFNLPYSPYSGRSMMMMSV